MTTGAVVMMVVICGFVWGGFALLLTLAFRQEGAKSGMGGVDPIDPPGPSP
jgi:hypothetical protein